MLAVIIASFARNDAFLIETSDCRKFKKYAAIWSHISDFRLDLSAKYCRYKSYAQPQALRAKETVSGRAFPWMII
ncbi:hypothetical protein [Brucella rhizosphaerae]|uniref:hypothetical protein n=1 Tax=Brucella rhizosphaerae TaxID=571254 RepID=UPI001268CA2D|nr:hypothetical protein [Brucella rhizosphaerae]